MSASNVVTIGDRSRAFVYGVVNIPKRVRAKYDWYCEKKRPPQLSDFIEQRREEYKGIVDNDQLDKVFNIENAGPKRVPGSLHQKQLASLFNFLARERRAKWDSESDGGAVARQHALVEVSSLRSEIVDLKSQITNSERMMAAWMVGSILVYSKDIISWIGILVFPLALSLFGYIRFREYQRNVFDLDCYLRELELAIRPDHGWVSYFFKTRRMERFFETRQYFWYAAIFASFVALGMGGLGWLGVSWGLKPLPFKIELLPSPIQIEAPRSKSISATNAVRAMESQSRSLSNIGDSFNPLIQIIESDKLGPR